MVLWKMQSQETEVTTEFLRKEINRLITELNLERNRRFKITRELSTLCQTMWDPENQPPPYSNQIAWERFKFIMQM